MTSTLVENFFGDGDRGKYGLAGGLTHDPTDVKGGFGSIPVCPSGGTNETPSRGQQVSASP